MADATIKIGQFETIAVVRQVLPVGTFTFTVHSSGNSILSSAYVKSGAGMAVVKWYDFHSSNGEEVAARFDLGQHPALTAGQKDRRIVSRIHNNARVEVVVTGGPAEVMVLASMIADFPVELTGNIKNGQVANLLADGGLPISLYDADDGAFYLAQGDDGRLIVAADVPETEGKVVEVTLTDAAWTLLTASVTARRAISIVNRSGQEVKVRYDNTGTPGIPIDDGAERRYEHRIPLYGKCTSGTCKVLVEEVK